MSVECRKQCWIALVFTFLAHFLNLSVTNCDLADRIFRASGGFFLNLEFSLARDVYLRSDWPLRIFWFWFYDTNAGSVLNLSSREKSITS